MEHELGPEIVSRICLESVETVIFELENALMFYINIMTLLKAEKLASMSPQDQESHLVAVMESVNITEKGPTSQKQIQLFNYIGSICSKSCIANALVRHGIVTLFSRQVKDTQQLEL